MREFVKIVNKTILPEVEKKKRKHYFQKKIIATYVKRRTIRNISIKDRLNEDS